MRRILGIVIANGLHLASVVLASKADGQKPITSNDQATKSPFTDEFGKFVEDTLHHYKVPGLSIAVIDNQDIYAEAYGYATLPDIKATPETLWYVGSTTKAFTAATIAHLIDSKNYSSLSSGWSTPLSSIIRDDFVLQDEWATSHLTLNDAVSHRTGMPRHDLSSMTEIDGKLTTPRDTVRNLRNLPLLSSPRTEFHYCNLMFVTLSHVIEVLTTEWLGDVFKRTIWEPLGMNSTYFSTPDAEDAPEHLSTGYYWDEEANKFQPTPRWLVHGISGAGAIISNVVDFAKWVRCLIHKTHPFSLETHADMRASRMIVDGMGSNDSEVILYGLGWMRTSIEGHTAFAHGGGTIAHGTYILWLPDANYGVVAFGNTAITSNEAEAIIISRLIKERLQLKSPQLSQYNAHGYSFQDGTTEIRQSVDDRIDDLYPERPSPPLPCPLNTTNLRGKYYSPGYGLLDFYDHRYVEDGKHVLIARRPDAVINYEVTLYHVSGDYWAANIVSLDNPTLLDIMVKAEFLISSAGKPSGLRILWEEGPIQFSRVG